MARYVACSVATAERMVLAFSLAALFGCARDGTTSPPAVEIAESWTGASSRTWTVPSQTEEFRCTATLVTADKYYTGFRIASPSSAQSDVYLSVANSVPQTGDFNCNAQTILGSEAIYAAGAGSSPIKFSGGKGVHVAAGQYLLMQSHLVNNSDENITAATVVDGIEARAGDVTTPMDLIFVGTNLISIPSDGAQHTFTGGCNAADSVHLVAGLTLMHALGRHGTFSTTPLGDTAATPVFDANYDPARTAYATLWNGALLTPRTQLRMSCSYVNNTGAVVSFGESSSSEVCFEAIYRYPRKPVTRVSPFECILDQSI